MLDTDKPYCQPCLSPVWDTALAAHALLEVGGEATERAARGLDWLIERQILDVVGDWAATRPDVRPGGWAFQYANPHYPDLDDTAVVVMALDRCDRERYRPAIERATEWIVGLQSRNGGWGAFDADNTHFYLNHIPFADHGALLDPPTSDVTARCVGMLAQLGFGDEHAALTAGARLPASASRRPTGPGSGAGAPTTSTAPGRCSAPRTPPGSILRSPEIRRAVDWLLVAPARRRRLGRGWRFATGKTSRAARARSAPPRRPPGRCSASWRWARPNNPAVARGIAYLLETQAGQRPLGRGELYRRRLPARLLSALSRLPGILPALGPGAVPQPLPKQQPDGPSQLRVVTVVAVTGLRAEARLARGAGFAVICAGGNPARTAAALDKAIAEGVEGLISFGIAGGLDPQLRSGTLVAASAVIGADGTRHATDEAWRHALSADVDTVTGDIFGGEAIVATTAEKAALHARTGALAVDLESLVVARAARHAELPFIVLRAIADPATRPLPPAALVPLSQDGSPHLPRVLLSVLRAPQQIPSLIRTARETQCALQALKRSAAAARRTFAPPPA